MNKSVRVFDYEYLAGISVGAVATTSQPIPVEGNKAALAVTVFKGTGLINGEFGVDVQGSYDGHHWVSVTGMAIINLTDFYYGSSASSGAIDFGWLRLSAVNLSVAGRAVFSATLTMSEQ